MHGKGDRLARLAGIERAVMHTKQADIFRAAALQEADIGGVIDDAGKIRVLEIDPDRQDMAFGRVPAGRGAA